MIFPNYTTPAGKKQGGPATNEYSAKKEKSGQAKGQEVLQAGDARPTEYRRPPGKKTKTFSR